MNRTDAIILCLSSALLPRWLLPSRQSSVISWWWQQDQVPTRGHQNHLHRTKRPASPRQGGILNSVHVVKALRLIDPQLCFSPSALPKRTKKITENKGPNPSPQHRSALLNIAGTGSSASRRSILYTRVETTFILTGQIYLNRIDQPSHFFGCPFTMNFLEPAQGQKPERKRQNAEQTELYFKP